MKQHVFMKWAQQKHVSIPHLLLEHYQNLQIDETELVVLIQIQALMDAGDAFPTPQTLSERMSLSVEDCAHMIGRLVRKRLLTIENKQDIDTDVMYECCSLEPLWAKLIQHLESEEDQRHSNVEAKEEGRLFQQFEQEFARPLSPIEAETLSMWFDQDQHSIDLIKAALREAVVSGKLNFRYIDRILFEWKRNGVQTAEQAHHYSERFRKRVPQQGQGKKPRVEQSDVPDFNWLEKL